MGKLMRRPFAPRPWATPSSSTGVLYVRHRRGRFEVRVTNARSRRQIYFGMYHTLRDAITVANAARVALGHPAV